MGTLQVNGNIEATESLIAGSKFGITKTASTKSDALDQDLVINYNLPANTSLVDSNSPGIGFHVGNTCWGQMIYNNNRFKFYNGADFSSLASIEANAFIGNLSGNASTASKLATARTIQINLASTSAVSFDGSNNITPGITGTLAIANGGTGATTAKGILTNLGITATTTELNYIDGVTSNIQTQLNSKVSTSRTINNKALSSNINLSASDVGAVSKSNFMTLVHSALNESGDITFDTISSYPTKAGIYRVGASITGLPDGNSGYGTLVIINAGEYVMHLYLDVYNNLYVGRTDGVTKPTNWMYAGGRRHLWANPGGSSAFAAQTITLNGYTHYNAILVVYKAHISSGYDTTWTQVLLPGTNGNAEHIMVNASGSEPQFVTRMYEWKNNGLYFGQAHYKQGTTLHANNDFVIPIGIYGI